MELMMKEARIRKIYYGCFNGIITNNDFAFIDVHNEELFKQNSEILLKIVKMFQDIKLKTDEQNQFLGDLFEGFLDDGIKQNEGQFFTPLPITRFIISSLPLESLFNESDNIPKVIDYACGAGHFLNEYAAQIKSLIPQAQLSEYYSSIDGIEKAFNIIFNYLLYLLKEGLKWK